MNPVIQMESYSNLPGILDDCVPEESKQNPRRITKKQKEHDQRKRDFIHSFCHILSYVQLALEKNGTGRHNKTCGNPKLNTRWRDDCMFEEKLIKD